MALLAPPPPAVTAARVTPLRAYFDGRPVVLRARVRAATPVDVRVALLHTSGRVLRHWTVRNVLPSRGLTLRWTGTGARGAPAADGSYRFLVKPSGGGRGARTRTFSFHGHVYPVRGRHWFRGAIGLFGAPRSGGRRHHGFDIVARCGKPVVAARGGRVVRRRYDPVLYGNYVIIRGAGERRAYWYAHLRSPARVRLGARVRTGERIGSVGETGNARTVGCHLHFELHGRHRNPFDPLPELRRWDRWS